MKKRNRSQAGFAGLRKQRGKLLHAGEEKGGKKSTLPRNPAAEERSPVVDKKRSRPQTATRGGPSRKKRTGSVQKTKRRKCPAKEKV